jgi:hypothetical protein
VNGTESGNPFESCLARSQTNLGTSNGLAMTACASGMTSSDAAVSPTFAGYNQVLVHYCDGSFMTSSDKEPVPVPGTASSVSGGGDSGGGVSEEGGRWCCQGRFAE